MRVLITAICPLFPQVLQKWDVWMARKLAGEAPNPPQAPIGHSPGDPDLKRRFRAPGLGPLPDGSRRVRRRIARLDFEDGSSCGCGEACEALEGGCCPHSTCEPPLPTAAPIAAPTTASNTVPMTSPTGAPTTAPTAAHEASPWAPHSSPREMRMRPCPTSPRHTRSLPGGAPASIHWFNGARHAVRLSVLNYEGVEVPLRTLDRPDDTASFASRERIVWRARALNGALMLEHRMGEDETPETALVEEEEEAEEAEAATDVAMPTNAVLGSNSSEPSAVTGRRASVRGNVGEAVVSIKDCRFRLTGAAAVVAATVSAAALAGHVDPSAAGVEEAIAAAAEALGEPTPWWLKRQAP